MSERHDAASNSRGGRRLPGRLQNAVAEVLVPSPEAMFGKFWWPDAARRLGARWLYDAWRIVPRRQRLLKRILG